MIIDDFLSTYSTLKEYSFDCEYADATNPYDDVVYPLINKDIPLEVLEEVHTRLGFVLGRDPIDMISFLRRSPAGVHCPHPFHHDRSMGDYSMMLYLNDYEGGTGLFRHKETGITYAPESQEFVDILTRDQSDLTKWAEIGRFEMKQNRAIIFDAGIMHAALPFGGIGEGPEARTVMTVFFK